VRSHIDYKLRQIVYKWMQTLIYKSWNIKLRLKSVSLYKLMKNKITIEPINNLPLFLKNNNIVYFKCFFAANFSIFNYNNSLIWL